MKKQVFSSLLLGCWMSSIVLLQACQSKTTPDSSTGTGDTANIIQTTLSSALLDSMLLPTYKDSVLKILLNKNIHKSYPVKWQGQEVQFVNNSNADLRYDTTGTPQRFIMEYWKFNITDDSADISLSFPNTGTVYSWKLRKSKKDAWSIINYEWWLE